MVISRLGCVIYCQPCKNIKLCLACLKKKVKLFISLTLSKQQKLIEIVHSTRIQKHIKVKGGEENVLFEYLIKMTQT